MLDVMIIPVIGLTLFDKTDGLNQSGNPPALQGGWLLAEKAL
ncbi:hypothetical protein [Dickeya dadantii]|nr:hypothetical protein [Dickeya dadantii]